MVQSAVVKTEHDAKAEVSPTRATSAGGTGKRTAQTAYRQRQKVTQHPRQMPLPADGGLTLACIL